MAGRADVFAVLKLWSDTGVQMGTAMFAMPTKPGTQMKAVTFRASMSGIPARVTVVHSSWEGEQPLPVTFGSTFIRKGQPIRYTFNIEVPGRKHGLII